MPEANIASDGQADQAGAPAPVSEEVELGAGNHIVLEPLIVKVRVVLRNPEWIPIRAWTSETNVAT